MKASRKRPKGAFRRPFGLVLCVVTAMPNSVGHQDLAALIARQPAVTERWRAHVRNSTFGTIHAASLSFPRIVGASIPDPYFTQLAALDPRALEPTGSIPLTVPMDPIVSAPVYDFPVVDRRLKGDRLKTTPAPSEQPEPESEPGVQPRRQKTKDMASRPPLSEPEPAQPTAREAEAVAQPALPKGDRMTPPHTDVAEAAPVEDRRARPMLGQDTLAKRVLGIGPRQPAIVEAPAQPVATPASPRARIAGAPDTLAKRVLGAGPRQPASAEPPQDVAERNQLRRAGLAAAHLNAAKSEARRGASLQFETADLESQRADLRGPLVPLAEKPAPRLRIAGAPDTLAKRVLGIGPRQVAATSGPVADKDFPPARVAAGADTLAKRVLGTGPRLRESAEQPGQEVAERGQLRRAGLAAAHLNALKSEARRSAALRFETADLESQRADLYGPVVPLAEKPVPASPSVAALEQAPSPARVEAVPAATEKTPDRFDPEAIDKLAQFVRPTAQSRVYFGTHALGVGRNAWEAWEPEEAPTVLAPPHVDTEIKRTALEPAPADAASEKGGETIAPKGEVTGEGKRPRTPAERLGLSGATRAKHAKCLANAIYFEARGEVERGQMAVAQVILNRAFSGYYPGNVCDVVYQNAHRHLACQFTFACDNHKDVVRDQPRWEVATRIAEDALDGKFWLPEIGKATHYHATYVNPWWVRTMTKHSRIGVHIFYRPKRWGSLDEIPVWGEPLEATGSVPRAAQPASTDKKEIDKRAEAQTAPPPRRSIFDPVEPINLPGG